LAIANAVAFDNNGDLQIGASTIGSTFTGGVSTTAVTGLVTLGGNITAPAGMTLGTATLIADTALDSDGGALTAGTITSNDAFALTLDGGSAGTVAVAGLANGGDLTILDSGSTTFSGAVNANTLTLTDTSGTIAVQGDLTVDTALVSQVNAYSVSLTGATNTIAGTSTFNNSGTLTLGDGGDALNFTGGVTAAAPSVVNLNGTVTAAGTAAISLGDADSNVAVSGTSLVGGTSTGAITLADVDLTDAAQLTVGTGIANTISLAGVLGDNGGAGAETLILNTTGAVTATGAIGADGNELDQLTVTQSGGMTIQSTLDAESVVLTDTTGTIAFQGNTNIDTGLTTSAEDYALSLTGGANSIAGATSILNTGALTLGDGAGDNSLFVGGLSATASEGGIFTAGTIRTTDQAITLGNLAGAGSANTITLNAATTINANDGVVTLANVTDGAGDFGLSLQQAGATGQASIEGSLTVDSLLTFNGAYDVELLGGVTVASDTTFANTTRVQIGDAAGDTSNFAGGLDTTAVTSTEIAGVVSSGDTQIDLGATTLLDAATLDSG
ncbi:MAG: hypothetical protein VYC81_05920, partial [Actinomycetota bacterium]|nr:hypothetical protein [Actinomycetota bacterium]